MIFYSYYASLRYYKTYFKKNPDLGTLICSPLFKSKFAATLTNRILEIARENDIPTHNIMFALDCERETIWRRRMFPHYKENRVPNPEFSPFFFEYAFNVVLAKMEETHGIKLIGCQYLEADDVISVIQAHLFDKAEWLNDQLKDDKTIDKLKELMDVEKCMSYVKEPEPEQIMDPTLQSSYPNFHFSKDPEFLEKVVGNEASGVFDELSGGLYEVYDIDLNRDIPVLPPRIVIVTNDNDFLQLSTPLTKIVNMKKEDILLRKDPNLDVGELVFCKALMGDKSDNIPPAVKRCGIKTAMKIVKDPMKLAKEVYQNEKFAINYWLIDLKKIPDLYRKVVIPFFENKMFNLS